MIAVRRAVPSDAVAIGTIHVAAWRSAYPAILPERFLANLSLVRQAAGYESAINAGQGVFVAHRGAALIGFASCGRARSAVAEGEVETLYVLDDHREQGAGRALLRAAAGHLAEMGCRSVFLWVLRDNPSRWFYERLGGRAGMLGTVPVAGQQIPQVAYVWDPIDRLLQRADRAS